MGLVRPVGHMRPKAKAEAEAEAGVAIGRWPLAIGFLQAKTDAEAFTGGPNFSPGHTLTMTTPYTYHTVLVAENHVVTICDEKDNYRFGFNGMEKDNEVKGLGNSLSYKHRIYDSRLGKFLSIDPLFYEYPDMSPYSFSYNNPIHFKDNDGRYIEGANKNLAGGKAFYFIFNGSVVWVNATEETKELGNALIRTETGRDQYRKAQETSYPIALKKDLKGDKAYGKTIIKYKSGTDEVERADIYFNQENVDNSVMEFVNTYRKPEETNESFNAWLKENFDNPD